MTVTFASTPAAILWDSVALGAMATPPHLASGTVTSSTEAITITPAPTIPHIFVVGSDKALWHGSKETDTWAWESLGGVVTAPPAVVSGEAGSLNIFVRGSTGTLYTTSFTNGVWSQKWQSLGGAIKAGTGPTAIAQIPNILEVFVLGTDNALYSRSWGDSGWGAWVKESTKIK